MFRLPLGWRKTRRRERHSKPRSPRTSIAFIATATAFWLWRGSLTRSHEAAPPWHEATRSLQPRLHLATSDQQRKGRTGRSALRFSWKSTLPAVLPVPLARRIAVEGTAIVLLAVLLRLSSL